MTDLETRLRAELPEIAASVTVEGSESSQGRRSVERRVAVVVGLAVVVLAVGIAWARTDATKSGDGAAKSTAPSISPSPRVTAPPAQAGLPPDRLLNPESVGEKALASLHLIRLELTVPNSWLEDKNGAVMCTAIASGWNDCVPTAQAVASAITVDLYVDNGYSASVWLLDSAGTLAAPIARLGEFSVDLKSVPATESPRLTVLDVSAHLSPTVPRIGELASSQSANDRFVSGNWVVFDHARWVY